jgi:glycogen(starch) synthase
MKILMLGWELPPHISGGLGIASEGIAQGLAKKGNDVDFFLPKKRNTHLGGLYKIKAANRMQPDVKLWRKKTTHIQTLIETDMGVRLIPYLPAQIFEIAREKQVIVEEIKESEETALLKNIELSGTYHQDLNNEISKYALLATQHAMSKKYDVIHAHDWVTFKAGRMASKETGIPLYTHCHSTEYDRNAAYAQPFVIEEERLGFEQSKIIFCVSNQLKQTIIDKYKIKANKIIVVPNACEVSSAKIPQPKNKTKQVVFIGRLTNQKNPIAFVDIARDLISHGLECEFTMIGDGHMMNDLKKKVAQINLTSRFKFPGFLPQTDVLKRLEKSDLLIVPSSSEPFGLVILEGVLKKIPVVAAIGTGVAEFIPSLPQIPLWDHYNFVKLAERLLSDSTFSAAVTTQCHKEASALSWAKSAGIIEKAYQA